MIERYSKEFCAIVAACVSKQYGIVKGDFLLMDKGKLTEMLDKNAYEEPRTKLSVWRDLGWIVTDGEHFTMPVRLDGGLVRKVKICLRVYRQLEKLIK